MLNSIEDFLAHAIVLEAESAEMFETLANTLAEGPDAAVSGLFRQMARYSRLHLADVRAAASGLQLPPYPRQEYLWAGSPSPECIPPEEIHPGMTPVQALRAALLSEERGEAFYAAVAASTADAAVRRIAQGFAAEEAGHVSLLSQWLASLSGSDESH